VVELPLAKVTKTIAAAPATEAVPSASGRHRVLVVDDNPDSAAMLADALTHMGYESPSRTTVHGAPARTIVRTERGAARHRPSRDGRYELAARLRDGIGPDGRLALIAITGYGQDTDRERSVQAGFQRHLVKADRSAPARVRTPSRPARLG
jgi:CheY-like chemotaxis protein